MLEFALAWPIFLIVLLFSLVLLITSYQRLSLQFASQRAVRRISVTHIAGATGAQEADRLSSLLRAEADLFGVRLAPERIHICPLRSPGCTTNDLGVSREVFTVRVDLPIVSVLPFYKNSGGLLVSVWTAGKTEPD